MNGLWCVVPAAGRGSRAGGQCPKQHQLIDGRSLLDHTLERLASHPRVAGLMVVLGAGDTQWTGLDAIGGRPVLAVTGGAERADSVLAGLQGLGDHTDLDDFVLVHDAARPCVRHADIDRLLLLAVPAGGGLLGAPLRDTLKHVGDDNRSQGTEPREQRWRVFTPQLFRRGELMAALEQSRRDGVVVSDEAMAMERAGYAPLLVEGAEDNIKVTTPADFALAQFLIGRTA
jgi:2-C-methyl-D-erythritol 4-phosphate cytidylyltransferase